MKSSPVLRSSESGGEILVLRPLAELQGISPQPSFSDSACETNCRGEAAEITPGKARPAEILAQRRAAAPGACCWQEPGLSRAPGCPSGREDELGGARCC